jgi:hydrogenase/urease accessory protein HupE
MRRLPIHFDAGAEAEGSSGWAVPIGRRLVWVELSVDGERVALKRVRCRVDENANTTIEGEVRRTFTNLNFRSAALGQLPPGHRQFLTVRAPDGKVVLEKLLSANSDWAAVEVAGAIAARSDAQSASAFLMLGAKHILTGYDHLLFLFSLLIVACRVTSTLKIITSFTIAHSLTLALAALDLVRVPGSVVEPIIAASIVFVGMENLVRGEMPKGRVLLTFVFGLVHGLGFASALSEAGLGENGVGVVLPLVCFNAGVELGQLLIAALVLPLVWKISVRPFVARRFVPACSALSILAGGFWLVQRLWPA